MPKTIASSQNTVVDDSKFKSATNESATSLAAAVYQADERKTFPSTDYDDAKESLLQSNEQTPDQLTDLQSAEQSPAVGQTVAIERPGFFTKIMRRIMALFQGNKIDVWPGQNSQSFV